MSRLPLGSLVLSVVAALAGCVRDGIPIPDADPEHPYPPPRTDVVAPIGGPDTLEIATWNLENFPAASHTPSLVADLISSLDLDVVVVQEIADEAAWDELLLRLRDHEGILSTHRYGPNDYQKVGLIYRSALVTAGPPSLLFPSDAFAFPRPALAVTVEIDGRSIEVIGVHLKAGREPADADRRRAAVQELDAYLRAQIDGGGEDEVVVLGDYNERVTSPDDRAVLAPLLDAPDRYTVRTEPGALAGGITYLGFGGSWIDHITTSHALDVAWAGARVEQPRLDQTVRSYRSYVSDHLPAILIAPR